MDELERAVDIADKWKKDQVPQAYQLSDQVQAPPQPGLNVVNHFHRQQHEVYQDCHRSSKQQEEMPVVLRKTRGVNL